MALIDDVHERADKIYCERKLGCPMDLVPPSERRKIQSNQVLALMEVLVEEIEFLRDRVSSLETSAEKCAAERYY